MGYDNNREDEYAGLTREQREAARKAKEMSSKLSRDIDRQLDEYERTHAGEEEKDEQFLGIIPMPGYMVGVVETGWNTIFGYAAPWLQRHAYDFTNEIGTKHLIGKEFFGRTFEAGHVSRASIVAATAAAVVPIAWQPISRLMGGFDKERKGLTDAAKKIAPVMDDRFGKHTLTAFVKVKPTDNEMIYAYRKHQQASHQLVHSNNFVALLNIAPSLVLTGINAKNVTSKKAGLDKVVSATDATPPATGQDISGGNATNNIQAMSGIASGIFTPMLEAFQKVNERKYKKKHRPFTATDMVLELEKQVSAEPNQRDYTMPKGGDKRSAPLVEYVMEIIRCHQLDMEGLDAEYVPVRKALDNQLRDVAEPIAEAIKKGDISTLALIRLIGEGQVVKNKGRSLAKPSEIKSLLEKMSANASAYTQLDPKEYFADAAFNKKELKEALDALQGEDKIHFSAMFPDSVLHEVGMKENEIKDLRAATLKTYESHLGKVIVGLANEDDKILHEVGLAKEEIKQIRDAADQVRSKGDEAVHEVRAKPNDPIGIERVLASATVAKILGGDVTYLGKLTSQASVSKVESSEHEDEAEGVEKPTKTKHAPAKKHTAEHAEHAGHAAKETHRRDHGSEHNEAAVS